MVTDNGLVGEDVLQQLFPVGMHVFAVDDNQVCLTILENMLLKCHYKVTTTTESVKALEMLRENRDMFDLVICDVNMPEMDGFKLLKQVGLLDMDLPFIMLSGHGDTESVMKGVMNGASDYILKPIRMEEVKTIWQHVVRKKINGKDQKKRKERSDSEEDNDTDGLTEKKPRFVWDTELHNKFLVAVDQLGLDKAYPKKIVELMNIEGLTRENVASHLQKFRLSLKRPDKQSRTDAKFDSTSPYLQTGSIGGRRFINSVLPSYASPSYGSGQAVCRLNTPSPLNFRRMSYASVPSFQSRNEINCFKMPMVSANEKSCFLPDFRSSIGTNQFQQNNYSSSFQSFKVNNANSSLVSCIPSIHHPTTYNLNRNSFSCTPSNLPLTHNLEAITKHSSVGSAVVKTQSSNNTLDSVVVKTQSPNNTLDSVVVNTQSPNNTFDSFGIADVKTKSQSMINPLDSAGGAYVKTKSQSMMNPLDTEKFYTDPEAMGSNDDCFYNHMLSLQSGFFDNSCVSLDNGFEFLS